LRATTLVGTASRPSGATSSSLSDLGLIYSALASCVALPRPSLDSCDDRLSPTGCQDGGLLPHCAGLPYEGINGGRPFAYCGPSSGDSTVNDRSARSRFAPFQVVPPGP